MKTLEEHNRELETPTDCTGDFTPTVADVGCEGQDAAGVKCDECGEELRLFEPGMWLPMFQPAVRVVCRNHGCPDFHMVLHKALTPVPKITLKFDPKVNLPATDA